MARSRVVLVLFTLLFSLAAFAAPSITSLSPTSGTVGTSVTITGSGFGSSQGTSTVKFNGTTASVTSWSATSIKATVPSGATTGNVVVTVGSVASNGVNFTIVSITTLSPNSGAIGASITISGSGFGSTQGTSTVKFNGTTATATSWSTTSITATVPSGAATGNVVVTVGGAASNGVSFTVAGTPSVTSLSPTSGTIATSVTITGANFGSTQGSSTVKFNGVTATPTSWSATSIKAPVPSGATSGNVVVHASGVDSNGVNFTIVSITSLSPNSGAVGASITISGSGFGSTQGTSTVKFNGTSATATGWSATSITATVPSGAITGNVVVTVGGTASNGVSFTVAATPSVTSLSPTSGAIGTSVTIAGTNFGSTQGSSTVKFNGVTATPTSWSATSIQAQAPSGATTGNVIVHANGVDSNGVVFSVTPAPSISALSPNTGAIASSVVISGSNFGASQGNGSITFNGTAASISSWSNSGITSSVPAGATTGNVVVTAAGGVQSSGVTFTVTPGPSISGLSPNVGAISSSVVISGSNFGATQGNGGVAFNGTAASISSWSNSSITASVPAGATTGNVVVTAAGGVQSSGVQFTVTTGPSISSLSPNVGAISSSVVISGSNFGATQGNGGVAFNGSAAGISSWSNSSITASVPAGATTGNVVVTAAGGVQSSGVQFTVSPGPSISSLSPNVGAISSSIVISGSNFGATQGNGGVAFNGTAASISSWSNSSITASVPAGATTGNVVVTAAGGVQSSGVTFTVTPGPSISGLSPNVGAISSSVVISGSNLGTTQGNGGVTFSGTAASISSWSNSSITASVPAGAITGNVVVTAAGGVQSGGVQFTVTGAPSITSLSPNTGPVTSSVVISGSNFGASQGNGGITFNGAAGSINSWSNNSITASVPAGATSGNVVVTAAGGVQSSGVVFTVTTGPNISALLPASAPVGAQVTLSGTSFGSTAGTVTFAGQAASISSWSDTNVVAVVPAGASSGNVVATTTTGNASNGVNFTVLSGDAVGPVFYTYDELGRLTGVIDTAGNAAVYVYDAVGNILSIQRYSSNQVSILSFTPQQGLAGASVTISGTGFSATASQNTVTFNGTAATVISANPSQIVATVPAGATTGPITVTAPLGSATSSANFTVNANSGAPTIASFTPTIGVAGTAVTVTGTNFDANSTNDHLRLNTNNATVTSAITTSLSTTVPASTGSGRISLYAPKGTTTSSQDFFVPFGTHVAADVGYTGRIAIGGSQTMTMGSGKVGMVLFDGVRGQAVDVQLSGSTLPSTCVLSVLGPDGSTLSTAACGAGTGFAGTVHLSATATYAIGVDPAGGSGSVTVGLVDASDTMGTITVDGPAVTATTSVTGQRAGLRFNATAFQRVFLKVTNVSMATGGVTLQTPDGNTQASIAINNNAGYVFYIDTQTLPTTGTYTLWVSGSSSVGSATLLLTSVPPDFTAPITIGGSTVRVPSSGNTAVGQNASLTFNASAGQKVSFSFSNDTYPYLACLVKLLDANGNVITNGYCDSTLIDTVTLAHAGVYTIFIDPSGTAVGTVTATVNNASDVTGAITIDGAAVTETTTAPGQDARITFNGTAGQRIVAYVSSVSNPSATVQLLRPDGSTQNTIAINNNTAGQVFFMDTQTLATTGTYTLLVQHLQSNVGSATLQLNSVPADITGTITIGGPPVQIPSSGNTAPGQNATLTFNGTAGQRVSMTFSNATFGGYSFCKANLLDPSGTLLTGGYCGNGAPFIDTVTLATTGTYTIFIDPQGTATGTTTVTLNNDADVTGTISIDGASVTATTTVPGQDARLTLSAPAGQRVVLQVSNISIHQAEVNLLKPDGTVQAYVVINNNTSGQVFFIDLQTLATAGTYTLWLQHLDGTFGSATLQLSSVPADFTATATVNGAAVRFPASGNNALGQNANLIFSATAGQQLTLNISNDTYTPNTGCLLTVRDPSGSTITSNYCGTGMPTTIGPFTASTTGTYSIYVDPQSAAVGTITIGLTGQ